ncbi:MAG: hypothetical protein ACO3JG_09245 [Luteolibacter sp.]
MKRSFWITLAVSVSICAAVVTAQSMKNRSLAEKLARQNATAAKPENRSTGGVATAVSSDERIERTRTGIEKLMAESTDGSMTEVLQMVDGLSLDELIAVTGDLPSSETRRFLVMLAAEQDALRVSRDKKLKGNFYMPEIGRMIAKQDPARALESLPKPKPVEFSASCIRCHGEGAKKTGACIYRVPIGDGWGIATTLFSEDAEAGLKAFLQMEETDIPSIRKGLSPLPKLAISGSIPLDDTQLPVIAAAINDPEFKSIRSDMINLTLNDAIYDEGVAAMAERAKSLPLSEADLKAYMDLVIGDGSGQGSTRKIDVLFAEPEATLQWVKDARSEEDQRQMIPKMVLNWAKRDANSAVRWLSQQAPSPVRDASISQLVTKGPNLDRESAAAWALEIQDDAIRAGALKNVVNAWKQEAPEAAEAWLNQQGLSQ